MTSFALVAEYPPSCRQNSGTPNLVKIMLSPGHPFGAVVTTGSTGGPGVRGPWDAVPTLKLFKASALIPGVGLGGLDTLFHRLQRGRVERFVESRGVDRLFIMTANNPRFAIFAAGLETGLPMDLYLVDNFVQDSHLYRVGKKKAQRAMDTLAARCERVFSISPAGAADLEARYSRRCGFLPIPIPDSLLARAGEGGAAGKGSGGPVVIHHAGTVHHLYADAMAAFVAMMETLANRRAGRKITVEFWGSQTLEEIGRLLGADLGRDRGGLKITRHESVPRERLVEEQKRADYLLIVNSFSPRYREQLAYSFSSKAVEYLAAATPVLVYGPLHSGLVSYLSGHGAAHAVCEERPAEATERFEEILFGPGGTATVAAANALARERHSLAAFFGAVEGVAGGAAGRGGTEGEGHGGA